MQICNTEIFCTFTLIQKTFYVKIYYNDISKAIHALWKAKYIKIDKNNQD